MILIIDNYDSFTHNLFQYFKEITSEEVKVIRNDTITLGQIVGLNPSAIVISPGPGRPEEAGVSVEIIQQLTGKVPILGVCLGHQAIGHALGGRVIQAKEIVHGKAQEITTDGRGLFRGVASPTRFTRYHSLAIEEASLPAELEITARSADGEIMGVRHKEFLLEGVQFHPESIASEEGKKLLRNFLNYRREPFDATGLLAKLASRTDLSRAEAAAFMEELTEGNLNEIQIAAFLAAFTTKGPTAQEIAGCAQVLQSKRVAVNGGDRPCLDTCGTGGDGLHTVNISSMAALVAAACGARVAKHGNRAASSQTGSADFYQALGLEINLSPPEAERLLQTEDFAFLFAPNYHGAMKFAGPVRKALKIKTIMNLMGPLVNPAAAQYQLIGVYGEDLCSTMAQAAKLLGAKRVLVVHGADGQDEISVTGPTKGIFIDEAGDIEEILINPAAFGLKIRTIADLRGGSSDFNAQIARCLVGEPGVTLPESVSAESLEAISDAVAINAGAALFVYGTAKDIQDGLNQAKAAIADGRVRERLNAVIQRAADLYGQGGAA